MAIYKNTPPIVTNGLVLALDAANPKSYVSGSTNWFSLGNPTVSGSLVNGPTFDNGNGGSILFSGTNTSVNLGSNLTFTESYTTEFVFKTTTTGVKLTYGKYSGTGADFWTGVAYNKLTYSFGSPLKFDITSINNVNDGLWKMGHCIYNKSINSMYLYVNSVLNSSATNLSNPVTEPSGNLRLGAFGDAGGGYNLPGNIGIFRVYNRVLSQVEITQNYNATKGRFGL